MWMVLMCIKDFTPCELRAAGWVVSQTPKKNDPQVSKWEVRPVLLTAISFEQDNIDRNLISLEDVDPLGLPFPHASWVTTHLQLHQDV